MNANMKIGCDRVADLIVEYIDGELDETTAELIKQHIESCPDCKKLYSDMALVCSAAAESAYEVPEELHGRVMDAVARESAASGRRARILNMAKTTRRLGVGIAAMLLVCVGIAGTFKLLPKLTNTDMGDSAPTETPEDASNSIEFQSPAEDIAQSGGNNFYGEPEDGIADLEVYVYKTVKATSVYSTDETGVPGASVDEAEGAYDQPDASAPESDTPSAEATKADVTEPTDTEALMEDATFPAADDGIYSSSIDSAEEAETTADAPAPSLWDSMIGTWEINSDAGIVRLILTGGTEPRYILYTPTDTVSGTYSLNDHFLTLNVLGKDSACYIVGVNDGVMTLLQVSPNGLF